MRCSPPLCALTETCRQGNPRDEVLANRLLEFLMQRSFHANRAVFRHNLQIVRTLVECWKDCLHVPYRCDLVWSQSAPPPVQNQHQHL